MSEGRRIANLVVPEPGFVSREVALKLAELAEMHGQVARAVRELPPAALSYQPGPGDNTIGMLLTHLALSEVHLAQVGLAGRRDGDVRAVLGIGVDDDGMPIEQFGGKPPAGLEGREVTAFLALLERALEHTRAAGRALTDDVLGAEIVRPPRPDGSYRVFDRRWILHHMVEHMAQHLGQIHVLVRHWRTLNIRD